MLKVGAAVVSESYGKLKFSGGRAMFENTNAPKLKLKHNGGQG